MGPKPILREAGKPPITRGYDLAMIQQREELSKASGNVLQIVEIAMDLCAWRLIYRSWNGTLNITV